MLKLSFKAESGVGAIAASPNGRDIVLGGREGLYVVDLTDPYTPPRYLPLRTPWEVSTVQWCHHPNHSSRVVSTTSQKLIVWNLGLPSHSAIEHVLHGHSRAITDVSFSKLNPNLLATCSIDTYVHIWDMRDPIRPSMSFADFTAGASQVRWSKTQPNILASAHQGRLLLWDQRKQNTPLNEISAHSRRINSIDFDDSSNNNLATASIDRTIKVWNLNDLKRGGEQVPRLVVQCNFPVWKTRYVEGSGAFVVPLRGAQNNAYLCDLSPNEYESVFEPIQTFANHKAPIKDLSFRREGNGYDLLTWGGDNTLNMWGVDEEALNQVGANTLRPILPRDLTFRDTTDTVRRKQRGLLRVDSQRVQGNHIDWIAGVHVGSNTEPKLLPQFSSEDPSVPSGGSGGFKLSQEVAAASSKFPKIEFETVDIALGQVVVTARGPWGHDDDFVVLRARLDFPEAYPYAAVEFQIEEDPYNDPHKVQAMDAALMEQVHQLAHHGKPALEFVLRTIMGENIPIETFLYEDLLVNDMEFYDSSDSEFGVRSVELEEAEPELMKNIKLDSTPLPRTCGAVWSNTGVLVTFYSSEHEPNLGNLYALDRILAGGEESDESSVSSFESEGSERRVFNRAGLSFRAWNVQATKSLPTPSEDFNASRVSLVNMKDILPCRPDMVAEYRYDFTLENLGQLVEHNAQVATKYQRDSEAYIWRFLSSFATPTDVQSSPMLKSLILPDSSLIPFFSMNEQQVFDLIDSALEDKLLQEQNLQLLIGLDCVRQLYQTRAGFASDFTEIQLDYALGAATGAKKRLKAPQNFEASDHSASLSVSIKCLRWDDTQPPQEVDPAKLKRRLVFASMLETWGLYIKRLEILKPLHENPTRRHEIDIKVLKNLQHVNCVFCLTSVTKQSVVCTRCNHVYHRKCLMKWAQTSEECATGCGCVCVRV